MPPAATIDPPFSTRTSLICSDPDPMSKVTFPSPPKAPVDGAARRQASEGRACADAVRRVAPTTILPCDVRSTAFALCCGLPKSISLTP